MATINEVAAFAGVSVATVSRYFSAPDKVSKKSKAKVEAAISALNYTPNLLARNFSRSRSHSILVLAPLLPFLLDVIEGIQQVCKRKGYTLLLSQASTPEEDTHRYQQMLDARLVDGIIDFMGKKPTQLDTTKALPPIVTLCDLQDESPLTTVCVDDIAAAEAATDYLISLGHKNIGHLLGSSNASASDKRLQGYKASLQKANISFAQQNIIRGDFSISSGVVAAKQFARLNPRPTAIFCQNDSMAIGLLQGLKAEGLKIPEDISVIGFDDIEFAQYCDPPLTTIRQPAQQLGEKAMSVLADIIDNSHSDDQLSYFLPTEMIIRASTGPAKRQ